VRCWTLQQAQWKVPAPPDMMQPLWIHAHYTSAASAHPTMFSTLQNIPKASSWAIAATGLGQYAIVIQPIDGMPLQHTASSQVAMAGFRYREPCSCNSAHHCILGWTPAHSAECLPHTRTSSTVNQHHSLRSYPSLRLKVDKAMSRVASPSAG
jgi:hypothetical protein